MTIVDAIIAAMKQRKLTNRKLCTDLKIDETTFSSFINRKRTINSNLVQKILDYLNLSINQ